MATFEGTVLATNGYQNHKVQVSGVVTQAAAKRAMEAIKPGATIVSVRHISNQN